jgi:DNA-binding transcriptional regulator LsrR (DeoR family)
LAELVALGCVGDVMCNFLDKNGASVAHSVNQRVMSIDLETVRKAGHVVIACGGANRAPAIGAAIKRIGCNTLVTDEDAARAILAPAGVR